MPTSFESLISCNNLFSCSLSMIRWRRRPLPSSFRAALTTILLQPALCSSNNFAPAQFACNKQFTIHSAISRCCYALLLFAIRKLERARVMQAKLRFQVTVIRYCITLVHKCADATSASLILFSNTTDGQDLKLMTTRPCQRDYVY